MTKKKRLTISLPDNLVKCIDDAIKFHQEDFGEVLRKSEVVEICLSYCLETDLIDRLF